MITKPLKAPSKPLTEEEIATLQFPVFASLKKDGIRGLTHPTLGCVSGTFKSIPNHYIRETINSWNLPYLDGEIVIPGKSFNDTQSIVMSRAAYGQTHFKFLVFDHFEHPNDCYDNRRSVVFGICNSANYSELEYLTQYLLSNKAELEAFEEWAVSIGEEGVMIRRADRGDYYKCGRSTLQQAFLLKIVRHVRDEATIIGFEEQQENCNVATRDKIGRTKRSKHLAGMFGKDTLGAFIVEWQGHTMRIGTGEGLTDSLRKTIWKEQDSFLGKTITFKYKPFGMLTLPRSPIFIGFRLDKP